MIGFIKDWRMFGLRPALWVLTGWGIFYKEK